MKAARALVAAVVCAFAASFVAGGLCALACAGPVPGPTAATADSHCGRHSPARPDPAGDRCEHRYRLEGRISPVASFPVVLAPSELASLSRGPIACGPAEGNLFLVFESPPVRGAAASVLRL